MDKYILLAVGSLAGISVFSLYVAVHLARGIICNYVYLTPYALPLVYVLGFFLGYALPHLRAGNVKEILGLFDGAEKVVVEAALSGRTQADVTKKLGKVKAHRTIKELEQRGIVLREKKGNTYAIKEGPKLRRITRMFRS